MDAKTLRLRARRFWRKEIRPLAITAIIIFAARSSFADWNKVPSGSMKPTILEGDYVFVNKMAYDLKVPFTTLHIAEGSAPQRGDIVVFYSPKDGTRLVKRTVGLPGDTVELREDGLIINGEKVAYRPIAEELLRDVAPADRASSVYASEVLPEGCFFMMGDNRDNSYDSRYFGVVKRSLILGRATGVVMSLDPEHHLRPRWDRFFSGLE